MSGASGELPAPAVGALSQTPGLIDRSGRFSTLDEVEHVVGAAVTEHRLVPATRHAQVASAFQFHGARDLATFSIRYGCALTVEWKDLEAPERLAFIVATEGKGQLLHGRRAHVISASEGAVVTSGSQELLQYGEDCETGVLVMNRRKLNEHCARLLGRDPIEVAFDTSFPLESAQGQSWLRLYRYASAEIANPDSLVRSIVAARANLEQMVLTGLLFGHRHTYSDALMRPQPAAAPFYVRRAEAFIEASFADPISIADIAAYAGVSARSLQSGFQTFRGTTPMMFLRAVRLRHAHRQLQHADPTASTVTEIAIGCGFSHLGEFAAHYKRTFGVSPRQTLAG
ncbi:AraC family transcriptional regulator [Microvirga antarctica]|uniref:AraC family transcriptional regulator n=1 Tax=Microvirga antarctica TaxID=2819233 RepID=UPI001B312B84|nr:AraC family transcriptional regulator [Microvirga antarctica]